MDIKNFDIMFLGGGPAGYEGAIYAAKNGLKVAVVEKDELGGTCLQRGCIPTKFLLNYVKAVKLIQNTKKMGIMIENYNLEIDRMLKRKSTVINKLTKGIHFLFNKHQIQLYQGFGNITDPNTIAIDNDEIIQGENIVIATGSEPAQLPFLKFDNKYVMSSNDALNLKNIPPKLLVIGAGTIGLEMALIYKYLGSEVLVVEIMDQILPGSDKEITQILESELKKQKIKIFTSTTITEFQERKDKDLINFTFKREDETIFQEDFSAVILSVGRKPVTKNLWDHTINIKLDGGGFIKVHENLETSERGIFACGDVIGGALLAHKASHQAIQIAKYLKDGEPVKHHPIPGAVFTFPEFAGVGITEEQAIRDKLDYKVGRFPYSAGSRSNAIDAKAGMVKIIADQNKVILGGHIVGEGAGELIQTINLAVNKGMKVDDFRELITVHPTLSENVFEAIGEIGDFSIHI